MNIFDRRYEMMPRAELEQLQLERLQALLARLKRNVRRAREKIGDTRVAARADITRRPAPRARTPRSTWASIPEGSDTRSRAGSARGEQRCASC